MFVTNSQTKRAIPFDRASLDQLSPDPRLAFFQKDNEGIERIVYQCAASDRSAVSAYLAARKVGKALNDLYDAWRQTFGRSRT